MMKEITYRALEKWHIDLFPEEEQKAIRENLTGENFAIRFCTNEEALLAAAGVRKNAEGYWVAWCWFPKICPRAMALVRMMRRTLRNAWKRQTHALVKGWNDRGIRLASLMGFVVIGRYEDYENPNETFWMMRWNP